MAKIIIEVPSRQEYDLKSPGCQIGRDEINDIVLDHPEVSPSHCKIIYEGGNCELKDMGYGSGVIVKGLKVESANLSDNDQFQIGPYVLRLSLKEKVGGQSVEEWPYLQFMGGEKSGQMVYLKPGDPITIGRSRDNRVSMKEDDKVSSRHAEIRFENGIPVLHDLKSSNGTRVHNQKVPLFVLRSGDPVKIGKQEFVFYNRHAAKDLAPNQFLIRLQTDNTTEVIAVNHSVFLIGRNDVCDLVLKTKSISNFHCVLALGTDGWHVYDLDSTLGTYLNGNKATHSRLMNEDFLVLDQVRFQFRTADEKQGSRIYSPQTIQMSKQQQDQWKPEGEDLVNDPNLTRSHLRQSPVEYIKEYDGFGKRFAMTVLIVLVLLSGAGFAVHHFFFKSDVVEKGPEDKPDSAKPLLPNSSFEKKWEKGVMPEGWRMPTSAVLRAGNAIDPVRDNSAFFEGQWSLRFEVPKGLNYGVLELENPVKIPSGQSNYRFQISGKVGHGFEGKQFVRAEFLNEGRVLAGRNSKVRVGDKWFGAIVLGGKIPDGATQMQVSFGFIGRGSDEDANVWFDNAILTFGEFDFSVTEQPTEIRDNGISTWISPCGSAQLSLDGEMFIDGMAVEARQDKPRPVFDGEYSEPDPGYPKAGPPFEYGGRIFAFKDLAGEKPKRDVLSWALKVPNGDKLQYSVASRFKFLIRQVHFGFRCPSTVAVSFQTNTGEIVEPKEHQAMSEVSRIIWQTSKGRVSLLLPNPGNLRYARGNDFQIFVLENPFSEGETSNTLDLEFDRE